MSFIANLKNSLKIAQPNAPNSPSSGGSSSNTASNSGAVATMATSIYPAKSNQERFLLSTAAKATSVSMPTSPTSPPPILMTTKTKQVVPAAQAAEIEAVSAHSHAISEISTTTTNNTGFLNARSTSLYSKQPVINKKRATSTRRLPFATISSTNEEGVSDTLNFDRNQTSDQLLAPQSPKLLLNNEHIINEEPSDTSDSKNNIIYAKKGYAFVRSSKSSSFRHTRKQIR